MDYVFVVGLRHFLLLLLLQAVLEKSPAVGSDAATNVEKKTLTAVCCVNRYYYVLLMFESVLSVFADVLEHFNSIYLCCGAFF